MNFREFLKENRVYLDGGLGTLLQAKGLMPGELPERWNITHPEVLVSIHKAYFEAGSNVVCANTFGANSFKFPDDELEEIISAAIENVRKAIEETGNPENKFVALDIGSLGKLLKPLGDLSFEDAVSTFAKTVKFGAKHGADIIFIETMNDSYETKAAILAAKENCDLPVLVSNAYGEDGKLMTGATPSAMVALAEGMGVDAVGTNCSLGPKELSSVVEELLACASIPVILKPNAGLPVTVDGKTVFKVKEDEFSDEMVKHALKGVRLLGGCCGTTPDYIRETFNKTKDLPVTAITDKNLTVVSSYSHSVVFDKKAVLIGERINPTGKKRFKQALIENDMDYILREGVSQEEKGADILDVNVGLPEIDEISMLYNTVSELQAVTDLPLQIDTSNPLAMEKALRIYNGKAMINSVNGKEESMKAVFPLVKKYGGLVVALTLDENGIPETAEGRVKIAEKIIKTAEEYGIKKKDIIFDTLAMAISADKNAAEVTLSSLKTIKEKLGCHTSLGVSNISFGLPERNAINSVFFAMALENGLSAAIMNPHSEEMMKTYHSYNALKGYDDNFSSYISFVTENKSEETTPVKKEETTEDLQYAIVKGFKEKAASITEKLLETQDGMEIVKEKIIPALDIVGKGFEEKKIYLPQLLMSAESAKYAFESIKKKMLSEEKNTETKGRIIIATVKGDIHDIGKNIVKLLLQNYGFDVIDLGKDVPPETIVETATKNNVRLVGLSALMTTTVPFMEETIKLLREKLPDCKVVVGGAVLTKDYAEKIGADKYAKDAMESVRYAEEVFCGK